MSEIIKKRLSESEGKNITIFLNNNFRFKGKILSFDENYIEIIDLKTDTIKIFKISEIKEIEVER